jgi:hypothetical protein
MTEHTNATLSHQLSAIRTELAELRNDMRHMKRKLFVAENEEPPVPIWNESDRLAVIDFWRKNDRWNRLPDASRRVLRAQLFGYPDADDQSLGEDMLVSAKRR